MKRSRKIFLFITYLLLVISFQGFAQTSDNTLKTTLSDSVITARIKSQFIGDNSTKATSINVETNMGVVQLTGIVDSELEATTAIQIAQSTPGVKEVDANHLYVKESAQKSKQPIHDSYITAKVKGILIRENLFNSEAFPDNKITVETKNSIVYLGGEVANEDQLKKAIELSKSISGVHKVTSKILISDNK